MQLSWTVYFWGWHILKLKRAGHLCCCMGYSYLRVRENYIICYLVLVLSWASSGFSVSFWLKDHHCRNMSLKLSGKERKFRHWFWAGSYYLFIYFSSKWDSVCEGKVTCFNLEGEGGPRKLWFNYLFFPSLHMQVLCHSLKLKDFSNSSQAWKRDLYTYTEFGTSETCFFSHVWVCKTNPHWTLTMMIFLKLTLDLNVAYVIQWANLLILQWLTITF